MNAYVLVDPASHEAIIIDPGASPERILHAVQQLQAKPKAIVCTHAHIDHVLAVDDILAQHPVPLWMPAADTELYSGLATQCQMFGLPPVEPQKKFNTYDDKARFNVGSITASVLATPGHTPGSCCLYFADAQCLIAGDLIFYDSIGRTDLWGGDIAQMQQSLQKIAALPDAVRIYNGHGPSTTLGRERRHNMFLKAALAGTLVEQMGG